MQRTQEKPHLTGMTADPASRGKLALARAATDQVLALVEPDSLYERPIPLRHRLVFYLGHLEAFDWNLIVEHAVPQTRWDADLDRLFAFGIDPDSSGAPADRARDWPTLDRVREYQARARECVNDAWGALGSELQHVCIEHRLMHAETLAYMLHRFDPERLVRRHAMEPVDDIPAEQERIGIPAGLATLGKRRGDGFGWDNEFEELQVRVEPFAIDRYKVTNREYLAFVKDGGPAPHFWKRENGGWELRRMFDSVPLPLHWPVWVQHKEATAYAEWLGAALPTEAQWHRAAYGTPHGTERAYPWGDRDPEPGVHGNFGGHRWDACSVSGCPSGESAFGVCGLAGNGWEWTSTPFAPFPGFSEFPFYAGYSAAFFDGAHYVLKGASPRTDPVFLRRSFRNWFRPDYPYVFAGFRCVYNNHS